MKRPFRAPLPAALLLSITLVACTSGTPAQTPQTELAEPQPIETAPIVSAVDDTPDKDITPVTVTFAHGLTGEAADTLSALTDEFNTTNVYGITVKIVSEDAAYDVAYDDDDDGDDDFDTDADDADVTDDVMSGSADLLLIDSTEKEALLTSLTSLDGLIEEDGYSLDDIPAPLRELAQVSGVTLGLPFAVSADVYYYNRNLFDEFEITPPTTWQELTAAGGRLMEERYLPVVEARGAATYLEIMCRQNGVIFFDADGAHFDDAEGKGKEAVRFVANMSALGYLRFAYEDEQRVQDFIGQRTGGFVGSSLLASDMQSASFDVGVLPLPAGRADASSRMHASLLVLTTRDEAVSQAAWEYMKYLTSAHVSALFAIAGGYIPVCLSAFETPEYRSYMSYDETARACAEQIDTLFLPYDIEADETAERVASRLSNLLTFGAEGDDVYDALMEELTEETP